MTHPTPNTTTGFLGPRGGTATYTAPHMQNAIFSLHDYYILHTKGMEPQLTMGWHYNPDAHGSDPTITGCYNWFDLSHEHGHVKPGGGTHKMTLRPDGTIKVGPMTLKPFGPWATDVVPGVTGMTYDEAIAWLTAALKQEAYGK